MLGLRLGSIGGPLAGFLFAAGAFAASLSWQLVLAGAGALAGRRLPARFQVVTAVAGNLLVLGLATAILLRVS